MLELCWWLLVGHILSDFVLQTDFMSQAKDPTKTHYGGQEIPRRRVGPWWLWMGAHGMLNGAVTAWILGVWWIGPLEALHHALTDWAKCRGYLGFWEDQVFHGLMKGLLAWIVWQR